MYSEFYENYEFIFDNNGKCVEYKTYINPLFISDKTYNKYKFLYTHDNLPEKYKEILKCNSKIIRNGDIFNDLKII